MSTDNNNNDPSRDACKAAIIDMHGSNSVCLNDETDRRMDNGKGVKCTAGMSPETCIEFFEQHGGNILRLAADIYKPKPRLQFNLSASLDETPSTPTSRDPGFKPKA
jgi:hypothetical protein